MTQAEKFTEIAEAIRSKTHRTSKIIANNFAKEISGIPCNYADIMTPFSVYYSNFDNAWEAVKTAMSYWNAKASGTKVFSYVDGQGCLKGETEATLHDENGNAVMDCSTYIGLVLRGIGFLESPYNLQDGLTCDPTVIECDIDKSWVENYFDLQTNQIFYPWVFPYYEYRDQYYCLRVLTASDMGQYYDKMGLTWFADTGYAQAGDLCFFYKENDDGTLTYPDRFMGLSHVGIMTDSMHYLNITDYPDEGNLIRSSIETREPFLYARPIYGALEDGDTSVLTPNKIDLIPNVWCGIPQGTTVVDGIELKMEGKKLTINTVESQTEGHQFNIISTGCPLMLPAGKYRLTGTVNNTGANTKSYEHELFGIRVFNDGEFLSGVTWSSDGNSSGERDMVWDIGGGCEFVIDEDETPINLNIWLSNTITYTDFVIEPVLYKLEDDDIGGSEVTDPENPDEII